MFYHFKNRWLTNDVSHRVDFVTLLYGDNGVYERLINHPTLIEQVTNILGFLRHSTPVNKMPASLGERSITRSIFFILRTNYEKKNEKKKADILFVVKL